MSRANGRTIPLSVGRRVICDFLRAGMSVPTVSVHKDLSLAELADARRCAAHRPSWTSIFTKAYAIVVAERPELRQALLTFPYERLFEYDIAAADVVVEAPWGDERILTHARIRQPERLSLLEIDRLLSAIRADPMGGKRMRNAVALARLPRVLRWLGWWYLLNVSACRRGRYLGTFGVSSVGNLGADTLNPVSPWPTLLHHGAVRADGAVSVRLAFDHRVLDAAELARAIGDLEQVLHLELTKELQSEPHAHRSQLRLIAA